LSKILSKQRRKRGRGFRQQPKKGPGKKVDPTAQNTGKSGQRNIFKGEWGIKYPFEKEVYFQIRKSRGPCFWYKKKVVRV